MKVLCHITKFEVEVDDAYQYLIGKSEWDNDPKAAELREALYDEVERKTGAKWEWNAINRDADILTEVIYEYPDEQKQEVLCYC